ncbi:NUDIX hydrolase [Xinfangfangia sp. D13-10-4-6]|nr:NUDIX hydrolase [Pseudogemmobacter hezensis]NPD17658.1 NUDIX hydrolase [Pseudogemmobacter hezensis]
MLRKLWTDFISLILRRPSRYQVAALCWRAAPAPADETTTAENPAENPGPNPGGLQVLLITSLTTGRWILPKGWPQMGHDGAATALAEAWEEAGIRIGTDQPRKIGRYTYHKRLSGDVPAHTMVDVYAIRTERLLDNYPEAGRRKRVWLTPEEAAAQVDEPELAALLRESPALITAQ